MAIYNNHYPTVPERVDMPQNSSAIAKRHSQPEQLNLILHTAVSYGHRRGAGIAVVQRVECASTGTLRNDRIPNQERKHSYSREQLVKNNIKTETRAHMLALVHAMGMARRAISNNPILRTIVVFSHSSRAVQTINHHIQYPDSLQNISSTNDRSIVKNVVTRVHKISRHNVQITIAAIPIKDEARKGVATRGGRNRANKRSKTMARQGGKKAWEHRRRPTDEHLTQSSRNNKAHKAESCLDVQNSGGSDTIS